MFFFVKPKPAYEMRISDWSSDVCSSDLQRRAKCRVVEQFVVCRARRGVGAQRQAEHAQFSQSWNQTPGIEALAAQHQRIRQRLGAIGRRKTDIVAARAQRAPADRSEEHTLNSSH